MFALVFFTIRQMVYGLSLLDLFRDAALAALPDLRATDEVYALLVGAKLPSGEARRPYLALVTVLSQFYWVAGTALGAGGRVHPHQHQGSGFHAHGALSGADLTLRARSAPGKPFALARWRARRGWRWAGRT